MPGWLTNAATGFFSITGNADVTQELTDSDTAQDVRPPDTGIDASTAGSATGYTSGGYTSGAMSDPAGDLDTLK